MSSKTSGESFLKVIDPSVDLYQMLQLSPLSSPKEIESAIDEALLWWGKLYLDPEFRDKAVLALGRLEQAKKVLLDPIAKSRYDRQRQLAREYWSQLRWEPVQQLMGILTKDGICNGEDYRLLRDFARKRKLSTDEFKALFFAEASSKGIRLTLSSKLTEKRNSERKKVFFRISLILFFCSILLLIVLPFLDIDLLQVSLLLSIPLANNFRLLIHNPVDRAEVNRAFKSPVNWLIGITVLGTPTAVALLEFYSHHLFFWGGVTTGVIWFCWLWIIATHYFFSEPSG